MGLQDKGYETNMQLGEGESNLQATLQCHKSRMEKKNTTDKKKTRKCWPALKLLPSMMEIIEKFAVHRKSNYGESDSRRDDVGNIN